MDQTARQAAWAAEYQQRRAGGHPGWTCSDSYERKQKRVAEALHRHAVPPGARFLELGCGAGNVSLWVANQGYRATGIDIVPEAIAWATERAGTTPGATFIHGNVCDMPCVGDGVFDVVFDSDCLHMIFEPLRQQCLAEVRRVLRPGGLFLLGGNVAKNRLTGSIDHNTGNYNPDSQIISVKGREEYQLRTHDQLIAEVTAAGFEPIRVDRLPQRGNNSFVDCCIEIDAHTPLH